MDMDGDRSLKEYWNFRAKNPEISNQKRIWYGSEFLEQQKWIARMIEPWRHRTVLDVGCGLGRYASFFDPEKYLGVDFSDAMIEIARKENPRYKFLVADADSFTPKGKYDLIFANMLTSNQPHEDFILRMRPFCNDVIIRGYVDRVIIASCKEFV